MKFADFVKRAWTGTLPAGMVDELNAVGLVAGLVLFAIVGVFACGLQVGQTFNRPEPMSYTTSGY